MVFVVVLSAAEFFAPVIILILVGLGYGLESGELQKSLWNWFSYWVFTPSFFLVAVSLLGLIFFVNASLLTCDWDGTPNKIGKTKFGERLGDFADSIFPFLFILWMVTIAFHLVCPLLEWHGEWLYNNSSYSLLSWLHE